MTNRKTSVSASRTLRAWLRWVAALCLLLVAGGAVADGDLPPQIPIRAFIKLDDGHADLVVRMPLVLFSGFPLRRRGPGYIDLADAAPKLKQIAVAVGHQIELSADGALLVPVTRELQLSMLSDRSFSSYGSALAHLQGPSLPPDTDLFWNQGFFDVHLEYTLPSKDAHLWVRMNVSAELAQRLQFQFDYLPAGRETRSYDIPGDAGWVPLDPRWYETAWLFAKTGVLGAFTLDRLTFFLCLVAPFRRVRAVAPLAAVLVVVQALTLTASAQGVFADVELGWLPLLSNMVLAAAVVLLSIANLANPTSRRRWFIAAAIGTVGGFGIGGVLGNAWQFAGTRPLLAVTAFNIGVAFGEFAAMTLAFLAVRTLFAFTLGPMIGVIVLSALAGHAGWHGMVDSGGELLRQAGRLPPATLWSAATALMPWLMPAVVLGIAACFLSKRFDEPTVPTLLHALRDRALSMGSPRA